MSNPHPPQGTPPERVTSCVAGAKKRAAQYTRAESGVVPVRLSLTVIRALLEEATRQGRKPSQVLRSGIVRTRWARRALRKAEE